MIRALLTAAAIALTLVPYGANAQELETATFAGGCFWCVESDFDRVPGVVETVSGYTGGTVENPTYRQVSAGGTGHREAVQIIYNRNQVTYDELLTVFWRSVDPTDPGGQFCDRGESYATAVFVHNAEQRHAAEASRQSAAEALGKMIVTPIKEAGPFFRAEEYHQDYYLKSPLRYRYYRWACGRNENVKQLWGDRAYQGIPDHG